jgi:DeoR family transcriptional regulator, ulaG and ulaABCDEF operon transcriptional repressor
MVEIDRHRAIVDLLVERPFATVRDLQEAFGVSPATIRRDIDKLHRLGKVRKVFGGIASPPSGSDGPRIARPYSENRDIAVAQKRAIAEKALSRVCDGDSLIIHGGSTCYNLGVLLANRSVRIFTNSMPLAAYLGENGVCQLVVAGGDVYREPRLIYDTRSRPVFYASKLFVGAQGLSADGILESHPLTVRTIRDLVECADEVILLADSRKFSIRPRHVALPLSRVSRIITDDGLTGEDAAMLREAGVDVEIAEAAGGPA